MKGIGYIKEKAGILLQTLIFVSVLGFSTLSFAQPTPLIINIDNEVGSTTAKVDFTVEDFTDVVSFQFSIHWDETKLAFDSLSNKFDPQLFYGPTPPITDHLNISWFDFLVIPHTISDGSVLFSLNFSILESQGSVVDIVNTGPTFVEVTKSDNGQLIVVPLIVNPGSVIGNGATIEGKVFNDADGNCMYEPGSDGFREWQVVLEGENTYYASTNELGDYRIIADTGDYQLYVIPPNDYWTACQTYNLQLDTNQQVIQDIPINEVLSCPAMTVDLSTPFLRRCFSNFYTVNYCNQGTATALGASVEIDLDPAMIFITSSIPAQSQSPLSFDLGDVGVGECGEFTFEVILDCDSTLLGETHCVEARIFPDQICTAPPAGWSGASIEVIGTCDQQNVLFSIRNVGTEDMTEPSKYIVIEDVIMKDERSFQLNSGESLPLLSLPANGSTYRVEAYQVAQHPGVSMPSSTIEGCGVNSSGEISLGFVNQFAQNDGNDFVSIDCQENIGAFDPNDKLAFPEGYGDEHYLEANTDIEYMIRFQNTGTDTAFNVVILDTLSSQLDLNHLRLGASSHPVELIVQGKDTVILKFRFGGIMLPDSNVNEVASHGFVRYKIAQKPDLPNGTRITNDAGIYFDYNEPVQTNEVFHTVGEEFVTVNTQQVFIPDVAVKAYPNPATERVVFELQGKEFKNIQFNLYDLTGRLVRSERHNNNSFEFRPKGLTTGVYFYKIESDGKAISSGKLELF